MRSPSLYPIEYDIADHKIAASVINTMIDSSFILLLPFREATVALPEIESDSNIGQIQDSRLFFGVSIAYLWFFKCSIISVRISRTSARIASANPLLTGREFFSDLAAYKAAIDETVVAAINPTAVIASVI
jgi:hypothetical protein